MKKAIKIGSSLLLSCMVLLSSGCSCKLGEKKVIERSGALKESKLEYDSNELVDFTTVYKMVTNNGTTEQVVEYKVERDVATDTYYLTTKTGSANVGEEIQYTTIEEKLYSENGSVKYQKGESVETLQSAYSTTSALMYLANLKGTARYYDFSVRTYETFRSVPFNACTPSDLANEESLPGILPSFIDDSLSCVAKRKLFSRNTTYTVNYRVSMLELTEIVVSTDKTNKITSVKQTNNIVHSVDLQSVENITYTVSYDDVNK